MSTGSQAAVTSPLMSTTAVASPNRLTSIVIVIGFLPLVLYELADGDVEIGEELDEVGQPGDVEDLAVVGGEPAGHDLPAFGPREGEHADDQRDAGGVDVVDRGKVEHDRAQAGSGGDRSLVGAGQDRGGGSVDLAGKLDDRGAWQGPGRGLTHARHVQHLQF